MKTHVGNILPIDSLPLTCIYVPDKDSFNQFYDIDENCSCGCSQWCKDKIEMKIPGCEFDFPLSTIYRCMECKQFRLIRLKKKYEKIYDLSNKLIENLKMHLKVDNSELLDIIGNTYAKLGCSLYGEKFIENFSESNQI